MAKADEVRRNIVAIIEQNPGLHFREIQRRTYTATGQLEYHLYQLERESRIVKKEDGKLKRYFSNETGNSFERTLLYHMRNRETARMISLLLQKDRTVEELSGRSKARREMVETRLEALQNENLVKKYESGPRTVFSMDDKVRTINTLKKYKDSFLDSMAMNLFSLLE